MFRVMFRVTAMAGAGPAAVDGRGGGGAAAAGASAIVTPGALADA